MNMLEGLGVALVTPFDRSGKVDYEALGRIIEHVVRGGVDFLVSLGTTGETSTLEWDEGCEVLDFTLKVNAGRKPVVAGLFAGNDTASIVRRLGSFDFTGITALLSASPAYNKPPQEGIFRHYMAIADASPLPVILYNVPGRTACNVTVETTLRLARSSDKIIGIKEASMHLMQGLQILKHRPEGFRVWSGDDQTAMALMAGGADGVISVIGNALPGPFGDMVRAMRQGDLARARHYNERLLDLHRWMYIDGNPAGVKAAMEMLGLCSSEVRLPLVPLREEHARSLREEMERSGFLSGVAETSR